MNIPSILQRIVERKKREVQDLVNSEAYDQYYFGAVPTDRSFYNAITAISAFPLNLIAEHKRASPSKGDIRPGSNPEEIAAVYQRTGVAAISVLTDSDFKGNLDDLEKVRLTVPRTPLLRKDFIIDKSQVYESRYHGADAILLIASILDQKQIAELIGTASIFNMDALVEVHNREELEKVKGIAKVIGINNRDLHSFRTDIQTTLDLLPYVPSGIPIVTESGISSYEDVRKLSVPPVRAMLVGERLMSARENPSLEDIESSIYKLVGVNS